jgi:hypothetical protein
VDEQGAIKEAKENLMQHKSRSYKISPEHQEHIIEYYVQLQDHGIPVSSQSLAIELLCIAFQMNDLSLTFIQ